MQGAEKQYYVNKKCATEAECEREIRGNMPLCHYIWYEDWKCAECCQGDRCNYYITVKQCFLHLLLVLRLIMHSSIPAWCGYDKRQQNASHGLGNINLFYYF